jgi:hypothetical protein
MKSCLQKGETTNFCCCIWDPGWKKIWIRDKHPGSTTLHSKKYYHPT